MIATGARSASSLNSAWSADRGDGSYRNPILYADYSDPDAIRVGDDYWLTSSSFGHVPGLPVLHSRDLVNWSLVNHALPQLVPVDHFATPRHGQGVWAPTLRYHAGKFWIFYPDPDFGLYVVTAVDPRGSWSAPVLVKAGKGLIDPCPLWDDDGSVWLIHGWAKSRSGVNNRITLHRLNADATAVVDVGEVIIDGDQLPGWHTIEGPKLYRRAGWYYIFAPAGGVKDGYQAVFRARNLRGPYENRIVLAQGRSPVNGPHQGAWVDTPAGEHWFLHFQELPAYGRVVHLQPVRWENDWPVMGQGHIGDGPGEPVLTHRKPQPTTTRGLVPPTSDEFEQSALGRQWQWQANPKPEWASLTVAPGELRLASVREAPATGSGQASGSLWSAAHLLMQKFPAPEFQATTRLRFSPAADGERAGLVVFGHDYAWFGLRCDGTRLRLGLHRCERAHQGGAEMELAGAEFIGDAVQLRVTVQAGGLCRFSFSADGAEFRPLGPAFQARSSYWVGAKVGLFATARADAVATGYVDVSWFRIAPASP